MNHHDDTLRTPLALELLVPTGAPYARRPAGGFVGPALTALLAACGMAHPGVGDAGAAADAPPSVTTDAGPAADASAPDAPVPVAFCEEVCAAPLADGCFDRASCQAACEAEAAGWSEPVRAVFATCAAEDPLCFRTLEDCMLEALHPTAAPHPVRIEGAGLSAFEGLTMHVFSDPMRPPAMRGEAVIVAGSFALEWTLSAPATVVDDTVILFYVDVDGDGRCRSAIDVTATLYPTWNGDLVEPAFAIRLSPPLSDADFVCALAP
jgi:hypothetical protein